jgi:nitrogen regulatory protein PII
MKMITAIVQPHRIDEIKEALRAAGATGMTATEARGSGRQKGHKEVFRGAEYEVQFIPKVRLEVVVLDDQLEACIDAIVNAAHTGRIGDGKIFVTDVLDTVRIRTKERGEAAL